MQIIEAIPLFSLMIILSLIVIFILSLFYSMWRSGRLPSMTPKDFIHSKADNKNIVVCCGDSITHGRIGYDWVESLRRKNKDSSIINAGINGDLAWNLLERLEDIVDCNPDYITILIGTNDAMGSQTKELGEDYKKRKQLPQLPDINWFENNYDSIVSRLKKHTNAKIGIISLPWIGEQTDSDIMKIVKNYNQIIIDLTKKYDLTLIPLFDSLSDIIKNSESEPYRTDGARYRRIIRANFLYYVFGISWENIGKKYGLKSMCDHIHLNEPAGKRLENLVYDFIRA